MKRKNPAAVALGSTKSERTTAAAKKNGKKGERPITKESSVASWSTAGLLPVLLNLINYNEL